MNQALVDNSDLLSQAFGGWPSFHDAEVIRLVLDRSGPEGPTLELEMHVFKMTKEVGPTKHYVLKNHILVCLKFTGVALEKLVGFNQQNVLMGLDIAQLDVGQKGGCRLKVKVGGSYGIGATFECNRCEVASVKTIEPSF